MLTFRLSQQLMRVVWLSWGLGSRLLNWKWGIRAQVFPFIATVTGFIVTLPWATPPVPPAWLLSHGKKLPAKARLTEVQILCQLIRCLQAAGRRDEVAGWTKLARAAAERLWGPEPMLEQIQSFL